MSDELMAENFDSFYSAHARNVPLEDVIAKLDGYLEQRDYAHAEAHLRFWLGEAELRRDMCGRLILLNELMGFYRKTERNAAAIDTAEHALSLCERLEDNAPLICGTTLANAAALYKNVGRTEDAIGLFRRAESVFARVLPQNDPRRGWLYNSIGLALTELGMWDEAESSYALALEIMSQNRCGEPEMAITYLNMANEAAAKQGIVAAAAQIDEYLTRAAALLDTPDIPHDSYYAHICERSAAVFGHYGYFLDESKYRERAERIAKNGAGE